MTEEVDVLLIGGGIMSATLGTLLQRLEPEWKIAVFERLSENAAESSNAWNNAGTGHAALCELNYMPAQADGSVDAAKAVSINEQFQLSRQLWASLVEEGVLEHPERFINEVPHITFVRGEKDVEYLRKRYEALKKEPLFAGIEYSEDSRVINQWAPLLMQQRRKGEPFAATRAKWGTDVDFSELSNQLFAAMAQNGAQIIVNREVNKLKQQKDGSWLVKYRHKLGHAPGQIRAKFVFVGAGGGALKLLQRSGIKNIRGYAVFPIGGQFLKTTNPDVVSKHRAKVYSQAAVGAPPMSVPHLDARFVAGEESLMFGPFATFSPKFLKTGSNLDLTTQIRPGNIIPMLQVAVRNPGLIKYLISELAKSKAKKIASLREFMPTAKAEDWQLITAGQRAQVIKKDPEKGGILQFGTEVVAAEDGTIAGLLGASPGASTAAAIMVDLLEGCFPEQYPAWQSELQKLIPSIGTSLNENPDAAAKVAAETSSTLGLS